MVLVGAPVLLAMLLVLVTPTHDFDESHPFAPPTAGTVEQILWRARYFWAQLRSHDYSMNMAYAQSKVFQDINAKARYIHKAGELRHLFTAEEMSNVTLQVHQLRDLWQHRPDTAGPLPFFTLGAASYLDHHTSPTYEQNAFKVNPKLASRLSWVYERLRLGLEKELGDKTAYHVPYKDWPEGLACLPGFHIFLASKVFEFPVAAVHYDAQYQALAFPKGSKFDQTLSFTLAVDLPDAPVGEAQAGLYTFHVSVPVHTCMCMFAYLVSLAVHPSTRPSNRPTHRPTDRPTDPLTDRPPS